MGVTEIIFGVGYLNYFSSINESQRDIQLNNMDLEGILCCSVIGFIFISFFLALIDFVNIFLVLCKAVEIRFNHGINGIFLSFLSLWKSIILLLLNTSVLYTVTAIISILNVIFFSAIILGNFVAVCGKCCCICKAKSVKFLLKMLFFVLFYGIGFSVMEFLQFWTSLNHILYIQEKFLIQEKLKDKQKIIFMLVGVLSFNCFWCIITVFIFFVLLISACAFSKFSEFLIEAIKNTKIVWIVFALRAYIMIFDEKFQIISIVELCLFGIYFLFCNKEAIFTFIKMFLSCDCKDIEDGDDK